MDWYLYDNEYLKNDGSAVKNVWLIQFQGKNYMKG